MSAFAIRTERLEGPISSIAVEGELDLANAEPFHSALEAARTDDDAPILLDLSGCEFLDSTALAIVVNAWRDCALEGKRVVISGCTGQVRRVVAVTQLRQEIPIFETAVEAAAHLRD